MTYNMKASENLSALMERNPSHNNTIISASQAPISQLDRLSDIHSDRLLDTHSRSTVVPRDFPAQPNNGEAVDYLKKRELDRQLSELCTDYWEMCEQELDETFVSNLRQLVLAALDGAYVPFAVELIDETWITVTFGVDNADRVELSLNPQSSQVAFHICDGKNLSDGVFDIKEDMPRNIAEMKRNIADMMRKLHIRFISASKD